MNTSKSHGPTFAFFFDKKNIAEDDLDYPNSGLVIRIVLAILRSKRAGVLQPILGAVLVIVGGIGAFLPGTSCRCRAWGSAAMKIGAVMMVVRVAQMLSPQPPVIASKQSADNKSSNAFGGVTNTS
ncbi:hypothetical protein ABKV92_07695 [Enterobacter kobei]|uniref:hypothetical protein n=1 Tax=Enterobacter kobei TaxID=208224 RepID=UPI0032AFE2FC